MATKKKAHVAPSLAQHFNPPEGYVGHFAWLCGYSADESFLNEAADRFTCQTQAQRASAGRIFVALMLDPGNHAISMTMAPGVAHLGMKEKKFRLLHAKVGILGFHERDDKSQWCLRLLVSTGNWTRQTMEESLDLIWRIDIKRDDLGKPALKKEVKQKCADFKAAWEMLSYLRSCFDASLLTFEPHSFYVGDFEVWIKECLKNAEGAPRFLDNRKKSILDQLPEKIRSVGKGPRNYLAMGSGFYEGEGNGEAGDSVPVKIIGKLKDSELLVSKRDVDIYINPNACQSISELWKGLRDEYGVVIRPPNIHKSIFGADGQRFLHAKFVYGANKNEESMESGWVYLGSSNLTNPGFCKKMGYSAGNLEAGVLFAVADMAWKEGAGTGLPSLQNFLPIQLDTEIPAGEQLNAGDPFEERSECYVAPPIACLQWVDDGVLQPMNEIEDSEIKKKGVKIIYSKKKSIEFDFVAKVFRWCGKDQPREVKIRWAEEGKKTAEACIPVMDAHGRLAAAPLKPVDSVAELQWQIESFPLMLDDEAEESGEPDEVGEKTSDGQIKGKTKKASYPIRKMMEMLESIANQQTNVDKQDWVHWCHRLECVLKQAKNSEEVKYFRNNLLINPLGPLRSGAFLPVFAEKSNSKAWQHYNKTLKSVEYILGVEKLKKLGDAK